MTIEKGFLRNNHLKPSHGEWIIALCLFFGASILIYELIIYAFQSMTLAFTQYFYAHYRGTSERIEIYNWFIAALSVVTGLNWAMNFLFRNHLNHPSFKIRFAARLAYHYAGLNQWGHFAWITRLLYQITFLALVFSLDVAFDPDIDYRWLLVLAIVEMYLSTWLMSHRYLGQAYFKYLRYAALCSFLSFFLVKAHPIDFQFYNETISQKSVNSEGEFEIPVIKTPQPGRYQDYDALQLFAYKNEGETLPRLRVRLRGHGFPFMSMGSVVDLIREHPSSEVVLYAMKDVTIGQLWSMESALRNDGLPITIRYRAEASFEEWSHESFSYYWDSEMRFLGPCELNDPIKPEGMACRDLIEPGSPHVLPIQYSNGEGIVGSQALTQDEVLKMIESHLKEHLEKAVILIEPDLDTTFDSYTQFKDQIRTRILAMRNSFSKQQHSTYYNYYQSYTHRTKPMEVKALEKRIPMTIVNLNKETRKMFADSH